MHRNALLATITRSKSTVRIIRGARLRDGQPVIDGISTRLPRVQTIKKKTQLYAGEYPALFFTLCWLKQNPKRARRIVQPTTQLVIEGFPRSANTFAVWAFKHAQCEEVKMAHHFHYPAQIIRAAQRQIPTLVLIRNPKDATTSLLMRDPQHIEDALKHYISFYRTVMRHRNAYVLGQFEEVTSDYGEVIERVNVKFGTRFTPFVHTKENVKKVYDDIERMYRSRNGEGVSEVRIARPSGIKAQIRRKIEPSFEAPRPRKLLTEAVKIYEYLTVG